MRRIVPILLLLSLLLLLVSTGVQAATGGYTVKPHVHNQDLIDNGLIDSSGAEKQTAEIITLTGRHTFIWSTYIC